MEPAEAEGTRRGHGRASRRYRSTVSSLPPAASSQGRSVPVKPLRVVPPYRRGAGGAEGPRSAARPEAGQSAGPGAHGEGVVFRGGQKHQHRWVDKKMEYCI